MYGRSAMAEVIEATVRDANNQIVSERGFKLAADPKVTLPTEESAIDAVDRRKERSELHDGARNCAANRAW
jgi:FKBP-type peptidyl-prolyl cis-trans isomerase (trigger factor)